MQKHKLAVVIWKLWLLKEGEIMADCIADEDNMTNWAMQQRVIRQLHASACMLERACRSLHASKLWVLSGANCMLSQLYEVVR